MRRFDPHGRTGGNFYKFASGADFAYDLVPPNSIAPDAPWKMKPLLSGKKPGS